MSIRGIVCLVIGMSLCYLDAFLFSTWFREGDWYILPTIFFILIFALFLFVMGLALTAIDLEQYFGG